MSICLITSVRRYKTHTNRHIELIMKKDKNNYFGQRLKTAAKKAGITGIKLAEILGVQPETVSRHMTGKTEFTMRDALRYAEILQIEAGALLFEPTKVEVFGYVHETLPTGATKAVEILEDEEPLPFITFDSVVVNKWKCLVYQDPHRHVLTLQTNNAEHGIVSPDCYGAYCLIKTDEDKHRLRTVWPEPKASTYTTQDLPSGALVRGARLKWACPIISSIWRQDLANITLNNIREITTDFSNIK